MRIWLITIIFLASVFLDGIILPAFFGFREGFLSIIFLITMLVYYEADLKSFILGILFSGTLEFYWGLKPGALILPLFAAAGIFMLLNKFFNVHSKGFIIFSGLVMFLVFWTAAVYINKIY